MLGVTCELLLPLLLLEGWVIFMVTKVSELVLTY
jgi:hypothetical protein